jgi:hypothetical protein
VDYPSVILSGMLNTKCSRANDCVICSLFQIEKHYQAGINRFKIYASKWITSLKRLNNKHQNGSLNQWMNKWRWLERDLTCTQYWKRLLICATSYSNDSPWCRIDHMLCHYYEEMFWWWTHVPGGIDVLEVFSAIQICALIRSWILFGVKEVVVVFCDLLISSVIQLTIGHKFDVNFHFYIVFPKLCFRILYFLAYMELCT